MSSSDSKFTDYKVKDIDLCDFGRKEIDIAEHEMPGLMQTRAKYAKDQPLGGVRIMGSLHMTIQTAVLIETLTALGAKVRWCSCNIFSTQDHAAAAIAATQTPVFAWKGEKAMDYWECTWSAINFGNGQGPELIVDDGGDATLFIHRGYDAENDASILDQGNDNPELKCVNTILRRILKEQPGYFHNIVKDCFGVSEETTTGVHRLYQMEKAKTLLFPAINVNDSVTKSKFDNIYGCRHSLVDGIMRATDVMLAGKVCVVCGFGDVGKGCAESLRSQGARVVVCEVDPICALQACMAGYKVARVEDVLDEAEVYVTATGNMGIIRLEHMKKMRNNSIVCNIGHFDNEIEVEALNTLKGMKITNIKDDSQNGPVDKYTFPDGHSVILLAQGRLVNLGCATGHPSFVMSCSFTNQALAQMELWKNKGKLENKVILLPKHLDEEVARLHLEKLGAKLTTLSKEQAEYINVEVEGPYKPKTYRY